MLKFNYRFNNRYFDETLLLLHGFLSNHNSMEPIAQNCDYMNTLLIDLPGFGTTKSKGIEYTMDDISESIVKLVDYLGLNIIHVYGYSMGGRVAISLLSHFPQRFNKFILESTSPGLDNTPEKNNRKDVDEKRALEIETDYRSFIKNWEELPLFRTQKTIDDTLFFAQRTSRLEEDKYEVADSLRKYGTGIQPSYWNKLNALNKVLILVGEKDEKFVDIGKTMNNLLKNSEFIIIKDVGHNIHFENDVKFNNVVKHFLTEGL